MSSLNSDTNPAPRPNGAAMSYPANRMSDAEYNLRRTELRETYGGSKPDAGARFEQELARLFDKSGWTQEELAKKEGKSQRWVSYRLLLGRFLEFSTSCASGAIPTNFTEGTFRKLWERTDKDQSNERIRFKEVLDLIGQSGLFPPKRKPIGKKLREELADGKWHRLDEIAKRLEADEGHVLNAIKTAELHGHVRAEKKRVGKDSDGNGPTTAYRMFRTKRTVSLEELTTKLGPILEGFQAEGKKNMATMSPATVAVLANRLKQLIEEWEK